MTLLIQFFGHWEKMSFSNSCSFVWKNILPNFWEQIDVFLDFLQATKDFKTSLLKHFVVQSWRLTIIFEMFRLHFGSFKYYSMGFHAESVSLDQIAPNFWSRETFFSSIQTKIDNGTDNNNFDILVEVTTDPLDSLCSWSVCFLLRWDLSRSFWPPCMFTGILRSIRCVQFNGNANSPCLDVQLLTGLAIRHWVSRKGFF